MTDKEFFIEKRPDGRFNVSSQTSRNRARERTLRLQVSRGRSSLTPMLLSTWRESARSALGRTNGAKSSGPSRREFNLTAKLVSAADNLVKILTRLATATQCSSCRRHGCHFCAARFSIGIYNETSTVTTAEPGTPSAEGSSPQAVVLETHI